MKEKSFFIHLSNLKKLDNFEEILNINGDFEDIFPEDEAIYFDKNIDYEIYEQVETLLASKDSIKKEKKYKRI